MSRRPGRVAAVLLAVVLVSAGCAVPAQRNPEPLTASQVPYGLTGASSSAATGSSTTADSGQPAIYLVGPDDRLVARARAVAGTTVEQRLADLLDQLAAGPTQQELTQQLSIDLGPDLVLRVRALDGETATVDLGVAADLPTGRASRLAAAEVVLTATSIGGVSAVRLTRDGDPVEAPLPGGQLSDRPVTAADYSALLDPSPEPS